MKIVNALQHKEKRMFRTVLTRSLLVPLTIALAATGITAAHASTPMLVAGKFHNTDATFYDVRCAGGTLTNSFPPCSPGNSIIEDNNATVTYTGTFSGTSTVHGRLILHPDGSATAQDIETFTGTVNGVPGTVTFRLTGGGPAGVFGATDVVLRATGALAGLHGVLDETGTVPAPSGPVGTYTGQIQFGAS
jgi:Protein of unknown function (DUF3224)